MVYTRASVHHRRRCWMRICLLHDSSVRGAVRRVVCCFRCFMPNIWKCVLYSITRDYVYTDAVLRKVFIFRALIRRRNALREVSLVDPDISLEKFRRVFALGCTQCLFTLPCALYVVIMNVKDGLFTWKGLADAHYNFSAIWQFPLPTLTERDNRIIQWNGWVTVFVAVVFFIFFGSSAAMWKCYMKGIAAFASRYGIRLPSKSSQPRSSDNHRGFVEPMAFKVRTIVHTLLTQS